MSERPMRARLTPLRTERAARGLSLVAAKFNSPEEVASHTSSVTEGLEPWEQDVIQQFMRPPGRVLDVGCGAGREAFALAERGFEVVGIDIAEKMIHQAKTLAADRRLPVEFYAVSVTDCDFPPQSFDYIFFSRAVYSYIPTRALRLATLKRLRRMLKPSGLLILSGYFVARRRLLSRRTLRSLAHQVAATLRLTAREPGDTLVGRVSERSDVNQPCFVHIFPSLTAIAEEIRQAGFSILRGGTHFYFVAQPAPEGEREIRLVTSSAFDLLASDLLGRGLPVRFTVSGTSMRPFLDEGDVVTLAPVRTDELRIGDIALVRRSSDSLTLHRLVGKMKGSQSLLIFQGDAVNQSDEPVTSTQVIGRVIEIQKAHKRISLQGWLPLVRNWLLAQKSLARAKCRRALQRMSSRSAGSAKDWPRARVER